MVGVLKTIGGGSAEGTWMLPMMARDLNMHLERLMEENSPSALEGVEAYLSDLNHWQMALITAFQKATSEWNGLLWDKISPATVRGESKVSSSLIRIGKGKADLWETYMKLVKNLQPDITDDEFHQLIDSLTRIEFAKLEQKDRDAEEDEE